MAISLSDALNYTDAKYFEISRQYVDSLSDLEDRAYPEHYIVNVAGTLYQYDGTNWNIFRPSAYELRKDKRGYIDFTDNTKADQQALKIESFKGNNISIESAENISMHCKDVFDEDNNAHYLGYMNIDAGSELSIDTKSYDTQGESHLGTIRLNGRTVAHDTLVNGDITFNSTNDILHAHKIEPIKASTISYIAKDQVIGAATLDSLPYGANIKLKANDDLHLDVQHEKKDETIIDRINIVAPEIRWVQKSLNSETNKYEDKNTYLFSEIFKGLDSTTLKVLQKQVTALINNQISANTEPEFSSYPTITRTWVTNPLTAYNATKYCVDKDCTDKTSDFKNEIDFQISLPDNMDYAYLKSLSVTTTIKQEDTEIYTSTETLDQDIVDKINNFECTSIDDTGFRTHSIAPTDVTVSEGATIKVTVTAEFNTGTIDASEVAYARRAVWTTSAEDAPDYTNFQLWSIGGLDASYSGMKNYKEVVCNATANKYAYFAVPTDWGTPTDVVTYIANGHGGTPTSYGAEKIKEVTISDGETDESQRSYTIYRSGVVISESTQVTLKY